MVIIPEATTLPTALPLIVPKRTPESTATFAGPPRAQPTSAIDRSLKNSPALEALRKQAKATKRMM